ncbi:hypothetical protein DS67_00185 [Mesotoga sp. SC_4PWA21]|nr:hypothetical protein DS67_00185 [Mesotoga sp. SC_4PWA21]
MDPSFERAGERENPSFDQERGPVLGKSGKMREEEREREGERTRKTVQTSGARQSLFSLLVFSWFLTTISVCDGSLSLFSVDGGPLTDNVVLSSVQRIFRSQSPSVASLCFAKASLAFGEASSGCAVQTKTIEKERCGEVRFAHERREREETSQVGIEAYVVTSISLISP